MEEPPGGQAAAGQDRVTRFTAKTVAARDARVAAWVFIALGAGCILFGGIFFAAMHSGHNVVATVTREGPCSNGVCTVDVVYNTPGGQVPAVMYGVSSDEVYGPPSHRLLNITYDSGDEANPTTNDMPERRLDWLRGSWARLRRARGLVASPEGVPANARRGRRRDGRECCRYCRFDTRACRSARP